MSATLIKSPLLQKYSMSNLLWLIDQQMEYLNSYIAKGFGKPRVIHRRVLSGTWCPTWRQSLACAGSFNRQK